MFNASCSDIHATLNFECEIDSVGWSEDSLFLAIGERSGTFHFVHTVSRQILFSQELESKENSNITCDCTFLSMVFTTPTCEGDCNLVILSSSGVVTEFSNLYLGKLNDAIVGGKFELVTELRGLIQVESINVGVVHQEKITGITVGLLWDAPVFVTHGEGDAAIAVWAKQEQGEITLTDAISSYILGGSGVVKAKMSSCGHFLVILDDKNMLSLWDIASLTMIAFWSHLTVGDFLLLSSSSIQTPGMSKTDDEYKLVVLTTANNQVRYLQVYTFPTMKQMYSLQISVCSILTECPSNQESIYFIEGVNGNLDDR